MRLFQEQPHLLSVEEVIVQPFIIEAENKVNPEIIDYIKDRTNKHNNRFALSLIDKTQNENIIIDIIKQKQRRKKIILDRKQYLAIKLLQKGEIFVDEKYIKDVQSLI